MKFARKVLLLVLMILYSKFTFSQVKNDSTFQNNQVKNDRNFIGFIGVFVGGSGIGLDKFQLWADEVSNKRIGLKTTNFINLGVEAFRVKEHLAYGIAYMHEGLFTNGSPISPNRNSIAIYGGVCPTKPNEIHQVLITVGIGYSSMNVKFHGDPPLVLQTPSVPNNLAKMKQSALWLNPKVCFLRMMQVKGTKFKVGLDGGIGFYLPTKFKYGYDYTYYTYSYSNGGTNKVSHTKFIGYTADDVPNISKISFHISGLIAF